jgi:methionyl-tRNA formyltransferase
MIRLAVFAQKPVGEKAFVRLIEQSGAGYEVVAACSNSSAANTWWGSARIAGMAKDAGIPFISSEEADDDRVSRLLAETKSDLVLSIQHGRIFSEQTLSKLALGGLNLHLAPLPEYRGFYGPTHALLNGEENYRVTLHWMASNVDAGDICIEKAFPIANDETSIGLYLKASTAGEKLVNELIISLQEGKLLPHSKQRHSGRYWSKRSLDNLREIKDPLNLQDINIKSRAFYFPGFEPAYISVGGRKHYILPDTITSESFWKATFCAD